MHFQIKWLIQFRTIDIDGEEDPLAQLIEQIAIKNKLNQKRKISEKKFSFSTISDSIMQDLHF